MLCITALGGSACNGALRGSKAGEQEDASKALDIEVPSADSIFSSHGLRKLTRNEMTRILEDGFGLDARQAVEASMPADLRTDGFRNTVSSQFFTAESVSGIESLSLTLAEAIDWNAWLQAEAVCLETNDACQTAALQACAKRLFGRPLATDQQERFAVLMQEGTDIPGGIALAFQAMLQSPQFLFVLETGLPVPGKDVRVLDDFEVAQRLALLLHGSRPDDELYAAAERGELRETPQILAQVARLLQSDHATRRTTDFLDDWLNLAALADADRSEGAVPFTPELAAAMRQETLTFFNHVAWSDARPLQELFDARYTFITSNSLASLYGVAAANPAAPTSLEAMSDRRGLVTQPAILTLSAFRDEPSLVERSHYLLNTFLCTEIAAPPPEVINAANTSEPGVSQRDMAEERFANPACKGCHVYDGNAFALDTFDGIGGSRTADLSGNAVRSEGTLHVPDHPESAFANTGEFLQKFAALPHVLRCLSKKYVHFAYGRKAEADDEPFVEVMMEGFVEGGQTFRALVDWLTVSASFRFIPVGEVGP